MVRFVAIDFETASQRPDSACQIGIVVVDNGEVVREISELIRPPSLYFSPRCVAVHGIHPDDVRDSPTWDVIWEKHQAVFEDTVVVAHNAAFDLNVLRAAMSAYGLDCPYIEYSCSRLIARRAWPGRTSYALKSAAEYLGLSFRHHDALEDAMVCARIVLAAANTIEANTFEMLESGLALARGRVQFGVRIAPKAKSRRRGSRPSDDRPMLPIGASIQDAPLNLEPTALASGIARAIVQQCGDAKPLHGRHVVLSGRLLGLDHASALAFLEQLGGCVQSKINMSTQFVIVGTSQDSSHEPQGGQINPLSSEQVRDIEQRRNDGQTIRVLSQRQLLALIPGGSTLARSSIG
jgi:DNA polymerase-3 subunit epsilon